VEFVSGFCNVKYVMENACNIIAEKALASKCKGKRPMVQSTAKCCHVLADIVKKWKEELARN
jgi:hypothetical protein